MTVDRAILLLRNSATPNYLDKMAYFKSGSKDALGVKIPAIRKIAKNIGINHELALELWDSKIHEARILASLIADSAKLDAITFDNWVADFNSWDLCDQTCFNLLERVAFSTTKIPLYSCDSREFVKRTAFTLIAGMAIHNKTIPNHEFLSYLDLIEKHADDNRNFVKKAVNWALRQIGKRNEFLRNLAIETAQNIEKQGTVSAKWIAKDALRELKSEKTINFIKLHRK